MIPFEPFRSRQSGIHSSFFVFQLGIACIACCLTLLWGLGVGSAAVNHPDDNRVDAEKQLPAIMVHSIDYRPLFYVDDNGVSQGVLIDYWKLWSEKTGVPVQFKPMLWHECLEQAKTNPNVVIPGIFYTPQRDANLDFSQAFLDVKTSLFVHRSIKIKRIEDLQDRTVAVTRGDRVVSYLSEHAPWMKLEVYEGFESILIAAAAGKVSIFAMDHLCGEYYLHRHNIHQDFRAIKTLYVGKFCAAVQEGNDRLLMQINNGLEQIHRVEVDDILEKWLSRSKLVPKTIMWILLGIGGGVIVVVILLNQLLLRKRVIKRTAELDYALTELRQSEDKYRSVFENTGAATVIIDSDTIILKANTKFEVLSGYSKQEIEGRKSWTEFVLPEDLARMKEYHEERRSNGKTPNNYEFRFVDRAQNVKDIVNKVDVIPESNISVASLTDITKRKKIAVAHRESKRRYRELVENINDVIYTVNTEGVITYISPRVNELVGYEPSEIIGKNFSKFVYEEDIPLLQKHYVSILRSGESKSIEYRVQKRSGRVRWVRSSSKPNRLRDDEVSVQGIIADISELRTAEIEKNHMRKQLHKAQKMEAIGTLAGGVAHDLNNILSGLVSYPELLLMKLPENSPMRKPIQTIQRSGEKAATIVQDLLTLARRGVTVTEAVDLNHIVREFFVSPEYEKIKYYFPEMQLELTLDDDIFPIIGSPVHLSKTVMNLVSNAAEAMSQGGKLHVTTQNEYIDFPISSYDDIDEGNYVLLTVTDNGVGIPVNDLDRIFEPFYTKKVMGRSGTGLGMAVVWGTIKDHNGYIDVQSKEGEGTTFKLYFPASSREIVTTKDKVAIEALRGNGEAILVVDDVEEQREIATGMMTLLGYRVVALSSGEEAVTYLRNHSVDLLILDMIMAPGIDGLETYKQILGHHPGQKAVIASGFSETDRVKEAQHLGAGVYIKKPYRLETIGLAVKQALETEADVK